MAYRRPNPAVAVIAAAVAVATLGLLAPRPGFAQLNGHHAMPAALGQVSERAQAAIVVPNLTQMNRKIAELRAALALPVPEMDDALGAFKAEAGINAGLNHGGSMVLVLEDLGKAIAEQQTEPTVLMLMPVSDYAAFVGNYEGSADEPITELTMPQHTGFARQLGGYALLGERREAVANYKPAGDVDAMRDKLGAFGRKYLAEAEAAMYIDIDKLRPALAPKLDEARQKAIRQMEAQGGAQGGANVELGRAAVDLYIDGVAAVLDSASAAVIALDLGDDGVSLSKAFHYEPGSALADVFPGNATRSKAAMARLPQQPYLFAMGLDTRAFAVGKLVENVLNALPENVDNPMLSLYARALPLVQQVQATASVYYAPTQQTMMGGDLMNAVNIYRVDNADQYLTSTRDYFDAINGLTAPVGAPNQANQGGGGQQQQITVSAGSTQNALEINGTQVDQYHFNMNYPPQMQQQMMQQMGPLASMFGMQGYNGYMFAKGGYVAMTTRTDPQLVRQALDTLESGQGVGTNTAINQVRTMLPADPAMETYLSVTGLAQTANLYLPMFGMEPIETPDDIQPIAMGVSVKDNSLAGRLYIPHNAVRFMVDTGKSISQQMNARQGNQQGGQNRGGGGGGAQPAPY